MSNSTTVAPAAAPRGRFRLILVYLALVSFFWIVINPFRMIGLDVSPVARILAWTADLAYPGKAQNSITVLTLPETGDFLKHRSWPLPVDQWRLLIEQAACEAPSTIFLDVVLYKTEQEDDGWGRFLQSMNDIKAGRFVCGPGKTAPPIPIFLARGEVDGQLGSPSLPQDSLVVTSWSGDSGYPLVGNEGSRLPQFTAAFAIARRLCTDTPKADFCPDSLPDPQDDRIDVVWGDMIPDETKLLLDGGATNCPVGASLLGDIVGDVFRSLIERQQPRYLPCSYHPRLPIEQYGDLSRACAQSNEQDCALIKLLFRHRVLMIGIDRSDYEDKVYSPIHGYIPGVFFHAMALDNLLNYGAGYFKTNLVSRLIIFIAVVFLLAPLSWVGARYWDVRHSKKVLFSVYGASLIFCVGLFSLSCWIHLISPTSSSILLGMFFVFLDAAGIDFSVKDWLLGREPPTPTGGSPRRRISPVR